MEEAAQHPAPSAPPLPGASAGGSALVVKGASEFRTLSLEEQRVVVMGTVKAEEAVCEREPLHVSAVIDKSGSMHRDMGLVKAALEFVVRELRTGDALSIVSFSCSVKRELQGVRMTEEGKETALRAIGAIKADGGTDLCEGILQGVETAFTSPQHSRRSVWVFTDGRATSGVTSSSRILEETSRAGGAYSLYTFGFGSSHDAELLASLAEMKGGMYYYLDGRQSIAPAFAGCLGGLASVAARDVSLQIIPAAGVRLSGVVGPRGAEEVGTHCVLSLPELFEGERRDLLVRATVPAVAAAQEHFEVARVVADGRETTVVVRRAETGGKSDASASVERQLMRLRVAAEMEEARQEAMQGDVTVARSRVSALGASLKEFRRRNHERNRDRERERVQVRAAGKRKSRRSASSSSSGSEFCNALEGEVGGLGNSAADTGAWTKAVTQAAQEHRHQRSAGGVQGQSAYATKKQKQCIQRSAAVQKVDACSDSSDPDSRRKRRRDARRVRSQRR